MPGGLISQSLANVARAGDEAAAISGLPDSAAAAQRAITTSITALVPAVSAAAAEVMRSATVAAQPLAAADAAIQAGDAESLRTALEAVKAAMREAKASVATACDAATTALAVITSNNQTLATIGGELAREVTHADAEADAAVAAADQLDKDKYYWLLLGPFGLIGLGVCIGMIVDANNRVNTLRGRVSELHGQVAQWTKMQADVDLLRREVPAVSATLLALQNGLRFLDGDITEVVADVSNASSGSAIARAFVLTAQHEVQTLLSDAA